MPVDIEKRKKSGTRNLPSAELRTHCVSVRLNSNELADLDTVRRRFSRGEIMRMCFFADLPTPKIVPEINQELALNCNRVFGNLATVATAMRAGTFIELEEIKKAVFDLRRALLGSK